MVQSTRTGTTGTPAATSGGLKDSRTKGEGARIVGSAHINDNSGPGPEIMAASSFEGEKVVNAQGETLGEIEAIMLDVRGARIAYAVLAVGGLLGIGEKFFAIPWRSLTLDTDNRQFILDVDKERLKNAPGFDKNQWPSMADRSWATDVHAYYGIAAYWE